MGKKSFAFGSNLSAMLQKSHINMDELKSGAPAASGNDNENKIVEIDLNLVDPNPFQPRKVFSDEELQDLAETIKIHGLIQPIAVRKVGDRYQIISGERRTRATRLAGKTTIKAQVYEALDDRTMSEWALIENIQRVDLNPIEIAESYQQLIDNHNYTHDDLAKTVGKSRSAITNALRLLKLPETVKAWIQDGKLSSGAARVLCSDKIKDPEAIAKKIIAEGLNVRQIEALISSPESAAKPASEKKEKPALSADLKNFESKLEGFFGTKVTLNPANEKQTEGTIVIKYYSMDDLTRIQELLDNH
ncbi:MAG: ParB/RepB/Spo0J family partition protein [Fibrobacter sp.]|nr:ParB/RepB/Spo0J family partition protein [Fibrobacter sp.]